MTQRHRRARQRHQARRRPGLPRRRHRQGPRQGRRGQPLPRPGLPGRRDPHPGLPASAAPSPSARSPSVSVSSAPSRCTPRSSRRSRSSPAVTCAAPSSTTCATCAARPPRSRSAARPERRSTTPLVRLCRVTSDDRETASADDADEAARSSLRRARGRRKQLPLWQETILLLGIALVLAIVIKALLRPGLLHPVGVDGAGADQERPDPGREGRPTGAAAARSAATSSSSRTRAAGCSADEAAGPTNPVAQVMAKIGLYPTGRPPGEAGDRRRGRHDRVLRRPGPARGQRPAARREGLRHSLDGADVQRPDGRRRAARDWEVGPIPEGTSS